MRAAQLRRHTSPCWGLNPKFDTFSGLTLASIRRGRGEHAGFEPPVAHSIDLAAKIFEPGCEPVTARDGFREMQDVHSPDVGKWLHVTDLHDQCLLVVRSDCNPCL